MRRLLLIPAALLLTQCVAPSSPPPAPPAPPGSPPPAPMPQPAPVPTGDWRDWPVTPGTWSYRAEPGGSVAVFGPLGRPPLLSLRCERAQRRILLVRAGPVARSVTVRTSSTTRTLPVAGTQGSTTVPLPATDPLLDAMGFSRGRFTVEAAGAAPLVVPAWAEVLRVTEDCRG